MCDACILVTLYWWTIQTKFSSTSRKLAIIKLTKHFKKQLGKLPSLRSCGGRRLSTV